MKYTVNHLPKERILEMIFDVHKDADPVSYCKYLDGKYGIDKPLNPIRSRDWAEENGGNYRGGVDAPKFPTHEQPQTPRASILMMKRPKLTLLPPTKPPITAEIIWTGLHERQKKALLSLIIAHPEKKDVHCPTSKIPAEEREYLKRFGVLNEDCRISRPFLRWMRENLTT